LAVTGPKAPYFESIRQHDGGRGRKATLSVTARAEEFLRYQWQKSIDGANSGTNVGGDVNQNIPRTCWSVRQRHEFRWVYRKPAGAATSAESDQRQSLRRKMMVPIGKKKNLRNNLPGPSTIGAWNVGL